METAKEKASHSGEALVMCGGAKETISILVLLGCEK
jgi:hypothetical protein